MAISLGGMIGGELYRDDLKEADYVTGVVEDDGLYKAFEKLGLFKP